VKNTLFLFRFLFGKHPLAIVAPYYTADKMTDGYFRRVKYSDDLLHDRRRVFLDFEKITQKTKIEKVEDNKIVVTLSQKKISRVYYSLIVLLLCREAYCESIWQVRKIFFKVPFLKVYVDVHGVVPEEEFLYQRYEAAQKYGDIELVAVQKSEQFFCVTQAMIDHYKKKYGPIAKVKMDVLPIVNEHNIDKAEKNIGEKPIVVYAGGIFKWQNIEMMQNAMQKQLDSFKYMIYTPTPDEFWATWGDYPRDNVTVKSVKPEYLNKTAYPKAILGFVLRDDIAVNNVACPTKISEYLRHGIIPIVFSEKVGDFAKLGMKYIALDDFINGKIPNKKELEKMREANFECLRKYDELCEKGEQIFEKIMLEGKRCK